MPRMNRVVIVRLLIRLLGLLPLPIIHALGALLGRVMAARPSKIRRDTRVNLELCFPEMDDAARTRMLREVMVETGKSLLEISAFWVWSPRRLDKLIRKVHGWEQLERARARGKGVIIAAPHLGAWELLGIYLSQRLPMHMLYKPPNDPRMDPLLREMRERAGGQIHPTNARGIRGMYKALTQGDVVGVLPDQEATDGQGVFAPLFGVPALSMTLLPKLAARSGAEVIYMFALRLPRGRGYEIHCLPAPEGLHSEDQIGAVKAMNAGVEACTRLAPTQYQWTYRRFRRQPDNGRNPYRGQPL